MSCKTTFQLALAQQIGNQPVWCPFQREEVIPVKSPSADGRWPCLEKAQPSGLSRGTWQVLVNIEPDRAAVGRSRTFAS